MRPDLSTQSIGPAEQRFRRVPAQRRRCLPCRCRQRPCAHPCRRLQGHPAHHRFCPYLWQQHYATPDRRILNRPRWSYSLQDVRRKVTDAAASHGVYPPCHVAIPYTSRSRAFHMHMLPRQSTLASLWHHRPRSRIPAQTLPAPCTFLWWLDSNLCVSSSRRKPSCSASHMDVPGLTLQELFT